MKCSKCKTELFECDVVNKKHRYVEHEHYTIPIGIREEVYRCPNCYTTKKVKYNEM